MKAGTATITATTDYGKTAKVEVTVKDAVATLSAVNQTASNAFTATFTSDASKTFTKDDFKVVAADGSSELAVKSVEFSADGLSAVVTIYGNFTDGTAYKVTAKDVTLDLTAKVGAVARIAITTASAEQNVETPIEFTLFDADGIDVTPSVSLDTTCFVSVTGNYSAANLDKASAATITMNQVGDTAEVTVTYNSNAAGAKDVTATQTITCVDAKATQGTKLFATTTNTNAYSNCAKFYLGLSDSSVSVSEGASESNVYFCAKDANGEVISYDSYEADSANDDVASATVTTDSGKYAVITVYGNTVGSTQLNVKATKNGKDTYYTIPVTVTKAAEATSMTVSVDKATMSNVDDDGYSGKVTAKLFDSEGNDVSSSRGSFTYEVTTTANNRALTINESGVYKANGADAKTYTIKVTGSDKYTGKTFVRNVTVTVKNLPTTDSEGNDVKLNLTYQIEIDRTSVDENPADTGDDSVTTRLYATYNGLFAGYVRKDTTGVTVAGGNVKPATDLEDVQVAAKFGTGVYSTTSGLYATGAFESIGETVGDTFKAVDNSSNSVVWTPDGSDNLAKAGTYTIEYRLITDSTNNKYTSRTQTFTVKNSVVVPTVSVTKRTVDSLDQTGIIDVLKTNVDMNNNTSDHQSITGLVGTGTNGALTTTTANKITVKYAVVEDTYGNVKWSFNVPVNATFSAN